MSWRAWENYEFMRRNVLNRIFSKVEMSKSWRSPWYRWWWSTSTWIKKYTRYDWRNFKNSKVNEKCYKGFLTIWLMIHVFTLNSKSKSLRSRRFNNSKWLYKSKKKKEVWTAIRHIDGLLSFTTFWLSFDEFF